MAISIYFVMQILKIRANERKWENEYIIEPWRRIQLQRKGISSWRILTNRRLKVDGKQDNKISSFFPFFVSLLYSCSKRMLHHIRRAVVCVRDVDFLEYRRVSAFAGTRWIRRQVLILVVAVSAANNGRQRRASRVGVVCSFRWKRVGGEQ